jgi:hypothetical protein
LLFAGEGEALARKAVEHQVQLAVSGLYPTTLPTILVGINFG